jgi:hypothetical protein
MPADSAILFLEGERVMMFKTPVADRAAEGKTRDDVRERALGNLPIGEVAAEHATINYRNGFCRGPVGGLATTRRPQQALNACNVRYGTIVSRARCFKHKGRKYHVRRI